MCKEKNIIFPAKINNKSLESIIKKENSNSLLKLKLEKFDGEQIKLKLPSDFSLFDLKCEIERYHNNMLNKKKNINWFCLFINL